MAARVSYHARPVVPRAKERRMQRCEARGASAFGKTIDVFYADFAAYEPDSGS